jgi:hypothetical protein
MKKVYFLLLTVLLVATGWSQKTWIGPATGGDWGLGTNWSGGTIPTAADDVVFDGGISGAITNVADVTIRTLTITGNSTITLSYTGGAPNRTLTISNANGNGPIDFNVTEGSQLIIGGGTSFVGIFLANNAKASIGGTLTINNGKTYNTNSNNNNTTVTGTGVIDNRGNLLSSTAARMTFESGTTYIHARNGGNIPFANWNANSNCIISGTINTIPTPSRLNQQFGNFIWDSPNQLPFVSPAIPSLNGELQNIAGDFTMVSTGTGSLYLTNTGNFTMNIGGNYIQTGGTLVVNQSGGNGTIAVSKDFSMSGGTLSRNAGTSVVSFGTGTHNFIKTGGTILGALDFQVLSGSTIDFGTSVLDGSAASFTLNAGAKIITENPNGLSSTGATGSVQTAIRNFSTTADYEFQGASTGVFNTGASTSSSASIVRNLTINNTSGSVTLSKPVTINPSGGTTRLYLQNGILLTTATNILTLNDDVVATGVAALSSNQYNLNSYVDGPLRKVGNDAFVFPTGKTGAGLRRISIGTPFPGGNNSTAFTAEFFRDKAQSVGTTLSGGLTQVSSCEYWTLNRSATGINQVRVTLYWESSSPCGTSAYVTQPTSLVVARYNGTAWVNEGRLSSSGSNTAGSVTSGNYVSSFSPFSLGTTSATENPLPVVFANVKAFEKNNGVQIEWSNLTEKDVASYTIERSTNGSDYSAIGTQLPISNQNDKADYSAFDANPVQGVNYYRIKAEETSGKIVYSKVLSVSLGNASKGITIYPNPVRDNHITIKMSNLKRGQYTVRIINAAGQDVHRMMINNQGSTLTQTINLPASVKAGIYNMLVIGNEYRETKTFIVQ